MIISFYEAVLIWAFVFGQYLVKKNYYKALDKRYQAPEVHSEIYWQFISVKKKKKKAVLWANQMWYSSVILPFFSTSYFKVRSQKMRKDYQEQKAATTVMQPSILPLIHLTFLDMCTGKQGWGIGTAAETEN